jgi:copper(I)-binding protein
VRRAAILLCACVTAATASPRPSLTVRDAWIHAAPAGAGETWAFATIVNGGSADAIASVRSGEAQEVVLRAARVTDAGRTVRTVLSIPVPSGASLVLVPDGWFIAFLGARHAFVPGTTVPATIRFVSGAEIPVSFRVSDAEGDPADGGR